MINGIGRLRQTTSILSFELSQLERGNALEGEGNRIGSDLDTDSFYMDWI
jgi:hypothetical protein